MTSLPGTPLFAQGEPSRLGTATEEQRSHIAAVLSDWLNQLQLIPAPDPQRVCSFLGGPLLSYRIDCVKRVGPYSDPGEFHAQGFCYLDENDPELKDLAQWRAQRKYKICLTHGDILPHNLLADENFRLTGLVDWECVAWMPDYWERTASFRSHYSRFHAWRDIVPDAFPKYDEDMMLEHKIQSWYDP